MGIIRKEFLYYACGTIAGYGYSGLSNSEIDTQIAKYAVKYKVHIPSCHGMTKKSDKLKNAVNCFSGRQQAEIIRDLCSLPQYKDNEDIKDVLQQLMEEYGDLIDNALSKNELIKKTKHWLSAYPASLKQYENALSKYERGIFERNTLDDMRLSFELLVKDLLRNGKSLENQISDIGSILKSAGTSVELRNMIQHIIKYYTDFQNNHVKHNDAVNKNEIEYIIELTSILMKFLIKTGGGQLNGQAENGNP